MRDKLTKLKSSSHQSSIILSSRGQNTGASGSDGPKVIKVEHPHSKSQVVVSFPSFQYPLPQLFLYFQCTSFPLHSTLITYRSHRMLMTSSGNKPKFCERQLEHEDKS